MTKKGTGEKVDWGLGNKKWEDQNVQPRATQEKDFV
jgi:hypothetical protein